MLLPISKVDKSLSYLSAILRTSVALLFPSDAIFFIFVRLKEVKAVSVPEKKAEQAIKMIITIIVGVLPSGNIKN